MAGKMFFYVVLCPKIYIYIYPGLVLYFVHVSELPLYKNIFVAENKPLFIKGNNTIQKNVHY